MARWRRHTYRPELFGPAKYSPQSLCIAVGESERSMAARQIDEGCTSIECAQVSTSPMHACSHAHYYLHGINMWTWDVSRTATHVITITAFTSQIVTYPCLSIGLAGQSTRAAIHSCQCSASGVHARHVASPRQRVQCSGRLTKCAP